MSIIILLIFLGKRIGMVVKIIGVDLDRSIKGPKHLFGDEK